MKRAWIPVAVTATIVGLAAALLPPLVGDDSDLTAGAWATLMVMLSTPLSVLLTALIAGSLRRWYLVTELAPAHPSTAVSDCGLGAAHGLAAAAAGFVVGGLVAQIASGSWTGDLNPGTLMAYGMIAIIVALGQGAGYLVAGMSARRLTLRGTETSVARP